ncbi:deoxyuridine 5'-triphosphate nucleotidohydrolase-like [Opisthocomus hoazin]|uniref:deoxyuridine 5'-triphosphate nucleotidohydrolase-like n=1 Tax=Opisthocomus hoazin TaxID=30419 RepID=UPI003F52E12B
MLPVGKRTDEREEPLRADNSSGPSPSRHTSIVADPNDNGEDQFTPASALRPATRGSLGLDLETAVAITLIDNRPQKIPTITVGPLIIDGTATGALLIGRSSSGVKGLIILPGLIDADYTGQIIIVAHTPFPPTHIPA